MNSDYAERVLDLKRSVAELEDVLTKCRAPPRYLTQVIEMRHQLSLWQDLCTAASNTARTRIETVHVHIIGAPAVGKTTCTAKLSHDIAPVLHQIDPSIPEEWNDNLHWTKRSDVEWFDGYHGQPIVKCDDILQSTDQKARNSDAMLIINGINTAPWQLPMSAIVDKAGTYFKALLLISNRNLQSGGVKVSNLGITDPIAFYRRIHILAEMLSVSLPEDHSTWRFRCVGPDGETVAGKESITYDDLLCDTAALLIDRHVRGLNTKIPLTKVALDQPALLERAAAINTAHRAAVRTANSHGVKLPEQGKKKPAPSAKKGPVKKQGSIQTKMYVDPDVVSDKAHSLLEQFATVTDDARKVVVREINGLRLQFGLEEKEYDNLRKVEIAVAEVEKAVVESNLEKLVSEENISPSKWDTAEEWIRTTKGDLSLWLVTTFRKRAMEVAHSAFYRWMELNKVATVCAAFAVVIALGGLVAGVYFGVKALTADKPALQSRNDKEEKAENNRIAREEAKADRVVNGKRRKELPARMAKNRRDPIYYDSLVVKKQIKEEDMPIMAHFLRNEFYVSTETKEPSGDIRVTHGQLTFLFGSIAITSRHVGEAFAPTSKVVLNQVYRSPKDEVVNHVLNPFPPEIAYIEGTELALLNFGHAVSPFRSLEGHLVTDEDLERMWSNGISDIRLLYRDMKGNQVIQESKNGFIENHVLFEGDDEGALYAVYEAETPPGSSGGLSVTMNTAFPRKIFGVHAGASKTMAYDSLVSREMIGNAIPSEWRKFAGASEIVKQLKVTNVEGGHLRDQTVPLGLIANPHSSGGTNTITPSPIANSLLHDPIYPITPITGPTVMYRQDTSKVFNRFNKLGFVPSEFKDETGVVDPLVEAYKVAPPYKAIDFDEAARTFRSTDYPSFNTGYYVLTPEDAVFGNESLGIAPILFTTSVGYNSSGIPGMTRWESFGLKKNEVVRTPFASWHPWIKEAIIEIFEIMGRENVPIVPVLDSLKAERRKWKRVFGGKTRLFYAGWLPAQIVSRMIMAHFFASQKERCSLGQPAVGVNPTSWSWRETWMVLNRHPNKVFMDAVNFDMHNQIVLNRYLGLTVGNYVATNYRVIIPDMTESLGLTLTLAGFRHAFYCMAMMASCAVHVSGAHAYLDTKTTNSGVDGTSQWNSMRGLTGTKMVMFRLLDKMRQANPSLARISLQTLWDKHVAAIFFGDDKGVTISDLFAPFASKYVIAQTFYEVLGEQMTNPTKDPITPDSPYDSWETADFLRRQWRFIGGFVYAPLAKDAIEESLFWVTKSNTAHATITSTIRAALWEAAMHSREYYETIYGLCDRACRNARVHFDPVGYNEIMMAIKTAQ